MATQLPEWQPVIERLEKLERQNRRMKQVGAAALILAAAVLLMGQANPNRKIVASTVEAERLVLKDSKGNERVVFSGSGNNPFGPADQIIAGPFLEFLDVEGNPQMKISDENRGSFGNSRGIELYNKGGSAVLASFLLVDDVPSLELYDVEGSRKQAQQTSKVTAEAMAEKDEQKQIAIRAKNVWSEFPGSEFLLSVSKDGPIFSLKDGDGFKTTIGSTNLLTPRTGETHKTSAASVVLFDKDKKVIWSAP